MPQNEPPSGKSRFKDLSKKADAARARLNAARAARGEAPLPASDPPSDYVYLPRGTEARRKTISQYEAALRTQHDSNQPVGSSKHAEEARAMEMNNMANTYATLETGDHVENLQHAISCYIAALADYDCLFKADMGIHLDGQYIEEYEVILWNLINAYAEIPASERAGISDVVIARFKNALEIYRNEGCPDRGSFIQLWLEALVE